MILTLPFNVLKNSVLDTLRIRRKPKVIQLPVTGKCNSRCVTCNVWKFNKHSDIDPVYLKKILLHPFFSNVESIGVNGGEFSLHLRFEELVDSILSSPKLKSIMVISNGLLSNRVLEKLSYFKKECDKKNVILGLTLSLDSVGDNHDEVRGIIGAFDKTTMTLAKVLENQELYCHSIKIGCTISKFNVSHLYMIESFLSNFNIDVEYHLAVPNKRIGTFDDFYRYSVLSDDRARLLAWEFFFKKMNEKCSILYKVRYFLQMKYLENKGKGRMALCNFKYQDITIDENMNLYLCATASEKLGDLHNDLGEILNRQNFKRIEDQISLSCDTCVHYIWLPTIKGFYEFLLYKLKNKFNINKVRICRMLLG